MEIVRAHDTLSGVVLKELPIPLDKETRARMISALDVLCWVLNHDHNQKFAENLSQLDKAAGLLGYQLTPREK